MMKKSKNNRYYVYALLDPRKPGVYKYEGIFGVFTHEPFYIGKGQGYRYYYHFNEKENSTGNLFKYRKIKNIEKVGLKVISVKIIGNLDNDEALEKECYVISIIGRKNLSKGPLTNLTDGGEGSVGYKHTHRARELIIASNKRRIISEETKIRISVGVKNSGFEFTEEMRKEQSNKVTGKNNYFYDKHFYGCKNHNWGKKLSIFHKDTLSRCAKNRTGARNGNSRYKYCIYDTTNKIEYHDIIDLVSINVSVKRKLSTINRLRDLVIIKKSKEDPGCSCSVLKSKYSIKDVPINKALPVSYLLKDSHSEK